MFCRIIQIFVFWGRSYCAVPFVGCAVLCFIRQPLDLSVLVNEVHWEPAGEK